ncbi:hypothetical protein IT41_17855 [Paracoccus halophilus]|uniref:Uncharacterized protein n=1 Tax=Paracoccus halophilus TaxID=376733 RepID=A0A099EWE5_9RHOB|nr:hypothetical protein IT41_17855 [Paracoccus halophilus]
MRGLKIATSGVLTATATPKAPSAKEIAMACFCGSEYRASPLSPSQMARGRGQPAPVHAWTVASMSLSGPLRGVRAVRVAAHRQSHARSFSGVLWRSAAVPRVSRMVATAMIGKA